MNVSDSSFSEQFSDTSSTISKPPPSFISVTTVSTQPKKPKPRAASNSLSLRRAPDSSSGAGFCSFLCFFWVIWLGISIFMLAQFVKGHIDWGTLEHARCKVKEVVQGNQYEMNVFPESGAARFLVRLTPTEEGVRGLNVNQTLPCFFGDAVGCVHTSNYNRTGEVLLQFHSDKRDGYNLATIGFIGTLLLISLFVLVGVIGMLVVLCSKS